MKKTGAAEKAKKPTKLITAASVQAGERSVRAAAAAAREAAEAIDPTTRSSRRPTESTSAIASSTPPIFVAPTRHVCSAAECGSATPAATSSEPAWL